MAAVRQDRQLAGLEPPVSTGGLLDGAELVAVAAENQGRRFDSRQVVEGVSGPAGRAVEGQLEVGTPVTGAAWLVLVLLHQLEHAAYRLRLREEPLDRIRVGLARVRASSEQLPHDREALCLRVEEVV